MIESRLEPILGPEGQYWAHLRAGRLMIQRSRSSGQWVFYPRLIAPGTGAADLEYVPISGLGTVYSTTTVRRTGKHDDHHNVCLVDLDEGVRMLGRIIGVTPEEICIGLRVQAAIERVDFGIYANSEQPVVVFRRAPATAGVVR